MISYVEYTLLGPYEVKEFVSYSAFSVVATRTSFIHRRACEQRQRESGDEIMKEYRLT